MNKEYRRGDMWMADLSLAVGSEQSGNRPILIISNDVGNRFSPTVTVAVISTQKKDKDLPTHVVITPEECEIERESKILLEQIRTIDKKRLMHFITRLPSDIMKKVDDAIDISVKDYSYA